MAFPVNVGNAIDAAIADYFAGQGTPQSIIQAVAQAQDQVPQVTPHAQPTGSDGHWQCGYRLSSRASFVDRSAAPLWCGRPGVHETFVRNWSWSFSLGPALVLFVGFVLVPIGIAVQYSLYNWSGMTALTDFIGLHNYREALDDPVFRGAILHNFLFAGLSIVFQLPLTLGTAFC